MIDKEFLLEELRERIAKLRDEEKRKTWARDFCRERRNELKRLVRQIESGLYDKEAD